MWRPAALLACLTLILPLGCMQTENSSSQDAFMYADGGSPEFNASKMILSQSCGGNCHWYHTYSESRLIAEGLVVAGDADNSPLFYRISGSSGPNGPKNMPSGGSISAG
jgi:hypothetical protein